MDVDHAYMSFADYTEAALHVYRCSQIYTVNEDRHLFATLVNSALEACTAWNPHNHELDELVALLLCVDEAISICLEMSIPNCGFYGDLPWLSTLTKSSNEAVFVYMPLSLLENLSRCAEMSLLGGKDVLASLMTIRKRHLVLSKKALIGQTRAFSDASQSTASNSPNSTAPASNATGFDSVVSMPSSSVSAEIASLHNHGDLGGEPSEATMPNPRSILAHDDIPEFEKLPAHPTCPQNELYDEEDEQNTNPISLLRTGCYEMVDMEEK